MLKHVGVEEDISGVDIGCGASCIFCLLSVRMNCAWKMFALEIDKDNVKFAQENISRNQLNDNVIVIAQDDKLSLFDKLFEYDPRQKTFCICNPPFFRSSDEVINSQNRTGKRKPPKSKNSGSPSELVFEDGGELGFVKRILTESIELREKIQLYSTMFGCKKNAEKFIDDLKTRNIESYTTTTFVQGKTTRWGIAWSFKHNLKTFKNQSEAIKKSSAPANILKYEIVSSDFEETAKDLKRMFDELKIKIKIIREITGELHQWELTATENTWSNLRRKRRAESSRDSSNSKFNDSQPTKQDLHIGFELKRTNETVQLQMFFISGSMSKDCTHQILQFIKNKFK